MLEELHKYTVLFLLRTTILSPYLPICNSAFDRMLIAQTIYEDLSLITSDSEIIKYDVQIIIN